MRRQGNMTQMKEQIKTPEKELNKREISNLSDADFKTPVIRMLKEPMVYFNSIKKTQAKHRWGLILVSTTRETLGPVHPVDSYRPHQSTTTLPLHR